MMLVRRTWKRDRSANYMALDVAIDNLCANMTDSFAKSMGLKRPFDRQEVREMLIDNLVLETPRAAFDMRFVDDPAGDLLEFVSV